MRNIFIIALVATAGFFHARPAWSQTEPNPALGVRPKPTMHKIEQVEINAQSVVAPQDRQGISAGLAQAYRYLAQNANKFNTAQDVSNLQLTATRTSPRGSHYHFQQVLGGIPVDRATMVVSVDQQNRVVSVFQATIPVPIDKVARAATPTVQKDAAYEAAWKALGAKVDEKQGLFSEPKAELTYLPEANRFRLVYAVTLHVLRKPVDGTEQVGLWRVLVDAVSGEVVGRPEKLSIDEKVAGDIRYETDAGDRRAAFARFEMAKAAAAVAADTQAQKVNGSGIVFDSDPVTTLKNATLKDNSPAPTFDPAYKTIVLLDITKSGNVFTLKGPWVQIINFETPATAPSSTNNGQWTFKRGNNGFNDVMTYFHIDRSQRYIQSLGFTNIQALSIEVDSDGLNGADNSHYLPGLNRLAFGHGCVDDNEDADVILHEYGHAITHGINPDWGGGDSGAIGEGFGDYWAETDSFERENGSVFQVNRTFDWDAAGGCWPGRRLDVKPSDAVYDPNRTYSDHEPIGNGVQSDELWSTPLYQSYVELRKANIPREQIDKIVLQSMFGVSSGFSMRDLAKEVVAEAKKQFPSGPHAGVFETQFKKLKILE